MQEFFDRMQAPQRALESLVYRLGYLIGYNFWALILVIVAAVVVVGIYRRRRYSSR